MAEMSEATLKAYLTLISCSTQANVISANNLSKIARGMRATPKQIYVAIPDGGGLFSLQAGATEIDFYEGIINNPDGTTNTLRRALKTDSIETMRSLVFTTYGYVSISIDGGSFHDLESGQMFGLSDFDFKAIYLDASVPCYIKAIAATTPHMMSIYDRYAEYDLISALGPLTEEEYDLDETVAQLITLDTGADMFRSQVEAYGDADAATDWTLEASNDNVHYFTIDIEEGQTSYHFGAHNATRYLRLSSAAAGVAGNKVSLVLTSTR